jgi:hypothetical protein
MAVANEDIRRAAAQVREHAIETCGALPGIDPDDDACVMAVLVAATADMMLVALRRCYPTRPIPDVAWEEGKVKLMLNVARLTEDRRRCGSMS